MKKQLFGNYRLPCLILLLWLLAKVPAVKAAPVQLSQVVGMVTDGTTGERLSHVSVTGDKKSRYSLTDASGVFRIKVSAKSTITISSQGYTTEKVKGPFGNDTIRIVLFPASYDLEEVVVRPKKQKYSKKNNPAVELMERVRANWARLNPEKVEGYNYDTYEKLVMGLSTNDEGKGTWAIPVKNRKKLENLMDTAIWSGERVVDLAVKEKSAVHVRKGDKNVEIVTGSRSDGLDKNYAADYTNVFLQDVMREIDVYDNNINVVRNEFVSPLSRIGADFYMYHIEDTVQIGKDRCIELSFAPHRPEMTGFNGKLFIPVDDSVKYVRRVFMRMPKAVNVNYIKSMALSQNYEKDSLGKIHKTLDDMVLHVRIMPGTPLFYFSRQTRRQGFGYDGRPDMDRYMQEVGSSFTADNAGAQDEAFWDTVRMVPLTHGERHLFSKESVFKTDKLFNLINQVFEIVVRGYIPTANSDHCKVYLGPFLSMVSHSKFEGWRVQMGGMTTANLMPHLFLRGYAAYGFKDHRWKGGGEIEFTFDRKKLTPLEFPMNNIRAGYHYDIDYIGRMQSSESSTIVDSWRHDESKYVTYKSEAYGEYVKEWRNNLTMRLGLRYTRQNPSNTIQFIDGFGHRLDYLGQAAFSASLRWAPGEKFVQNLDNRSLVNRNGLIMILRQEYGPKHLFGSRYSLSKTELSVNKTFWLSAFGYIDFRFNAAKIWTQVPFTELLWQNANTSYFTDGHSYVLLKPMEFAMDQYFDIDIQYHPRGLLFDRIPFIKKLKLREFIGFKGFMGHLSRRNDPARAQGVLKFPDPDTKPMGKQPYMECSVGIENIFTFIRVEYVWRCTYRHEPGISHGGVRIGFHATF